MEEGQGQEEGKVWTEVAHHAYCFFALVCVQLYGGHMAGLQARAESLEFGSHG